MSCRKHSPGNPCCVPPDCVSKCDAYIPADTWDIEFLGRTVTLYQHPTYKCYYSADDCVLESVVEEDTWTIEGDWEPGTITPCTGESFPCPGVERDIVDKQVKYRVSVTRFSQVRRYASIQIYPASPTSNLLKVYIRYDLSKTYFHGASWSVQNRYRVSVVNCPSVSVGSWVEDSIPTMLSVEKPSYFDVGLCGYGALSNFTTCPIELGDVVTPTTWGVRSIGSYRSVGSDCSVSSLNENLGESISVRKSTGLPLNALATSWTPCSSILGTGTCDRQVRYLRNYESATFACESIPSTISCPSGFSTIPSFSTIEPCDSRDLSFSFPAVPGSLTVTL
jgi:hypothetical protein